MKHPVSGWRHIGLPFLFVAVICIALIWAGCDRQQSLTGPASAPEVSSATKIVSTTNGTVRLAFTGTYTGEIAARRHWENFTVKNTSDAGVRISELVLDLGETREGAFIHCWRGTPGTGWFCPLYTDDGWDVGMTSWYGIQNGSTFMRLTFDKFEPGMTFRFRIDLDGGLPTAQYTEFVTGSGFVGAKMRAVFGLPGDVSSETGSETVIGDFQPTGEYTASF
jgi:hypothetical protein